MVAIGRDTILLVSSVEIWKIYTLARTTLIRARQRLMNNRIFPLKFKELCQCCIPRTLEMSKYYPPALCLCLHRPVCITSESIDKDPEKLFSETWDI